MTELQFLWFISLNNCYASQTNVQKSCMWSVHCCSLGQCVRSGLCSVYSSDEWTQLPVIHFDKRIERLQTGLDDMISRSQEIMIRNRNLRSTDGLHSLQRHSMNQTVSFLSWDDNTKAWWKESRCQTQSRLFLFSHISVQIKHHNIKRSAH